MADLKLACTCGAVRWTLHEGPKRSGVRYTCHCDDCQAFACFTGRAGDILDAAGGTDAYQLPASRVSLEAGRGALACIHMTKHRLLRWYCATCRLPVANTYDKAQRSFITIPLTGAPPEQREGVLGPSRGHVWIKFAAGDVSGVKKANIPAILWRMGARMFMARVTGDYRNNPFFEPGSGLPIVMPQRLTPVERAALNARAGQRRRAAP